MATYSLELESASCAINRWYVCTNLLMWCPHGMRPWKPLRSKFDTELWRSAAGTIAYLSNPRSLAFQHPVREATHLRCFNQKLVRPGVCLLNKLCCRLKQSLYNQQGPVFSTLAGARKFVRVVAI